MGSKYTDSKTGQRMEVVYRAETGGKRFLRKVGQVAMVAGEAVGVGLITWFAPAAIGGIALLVGGALALGHVAGRLEAAHNHIRARRGLETSKYDYEVGKLGAAAMGALATLQTLGYNTLGAIFSPFVALGFYKISEISMQWQGRMERWLDTKAPLRQVHRAIGQVATTPDPTPQLALPAAPAMSAPATMPPYTVYSSTQQ